MAYLDLQVRGGNAKQKKLARDIVKFSMDYLKLNRFNLEIHLKLGRVKDADGYCVWEDDNIRPREFTIECRANQKKEDFMTTIMHEMVHVKQYARGEMKERYLGDHRVLWKGKDHSDTTYEDQPWEKEAYKMQEVMLKAYYKELGK